MGGLALNDLCRGRKMTGSPSDKPVSLKDLQAHKLMDRMNLQVERHGVRYVEAIDSEGENMSH